MLTRCILAERKKTASFTDPAGLYSDSHYSGNYGNL